MQQEQTKSGPIVAAIIVAAGRGVRAGGTVPKQYRKLAGATVVRASIGAFTGHPQVGLVQPVIHPGDQELFVNATAGLAMLPPVSGGDTRQASVRAGLEALAPQRPDLVLVHDAARPFVSSSLIDRAIETGLNGQAAVPGLPVADTIKTIDTTGRVTGTVERGAIRSVQTPQSFRFDILHDAHRKAHAAGREDFPDDAALLEWTGIPVVVFAGEQANVKLTTREDFSRFAGDQHLSDIRTATGFDVHAFAPGDHVTIGGIRVPHDRALTGHSDADVALHALTDAILGTLADGDIGSHFPPSEPQWRGAASDQFLAFAVERVRARGGRITLLDVTLMCEAPKIGPHRDAMRARIAEIAGIEMGRVAVKATTTEQLGFTGRREGIAALATATVRLPGSDNG